MQFENAGVSYVTNYLVANLVNVWAGFTISFTVTALKQGSLKRSQI